MAGQILNPVDSAERLNSRILGLIVHELRSPTAVVNGYLHLLLKRRSDDLPSADRKLIEDASRGCARLTRVLQELDDLADLEARNPIRAPATVPIFTLCEEVVRDLAQTADAPLACHCDAGDWDACVHGDPARLRQALEALTGVTVRERRGRAVEVYAFVSREHSPPRATIAFGDAGLSERRAELLAANGAFDRWRGGTGLALPIAGRIVDVHGGRLWSLSGPDVSASAISLPLKGV